MEEVPALSGMIDTDVVVPTADEDEEVKVDIIVEGGWMARVSEVAEWVKEMKD